jgi:hypothetical protein
MDIDLIYKTVQKCYIFTPEFFIKKGIEIEPNIMQDQSLIKSVICFAAHKKLPGNVNKN